MSNLKAFAVGDSEIYAAESAEQALAIGIDEYGVDQDIGLDEVIELTDADLDKEYPEFDENEVLTGGTTTIRKWLSEMVGPGYLCGSDW